MKLKFLLVIALGLLFSCNQKKNTKPELSEQDKLKLEAVSLAEEYAKEQLTDAKTMVVQNGITVINDDEKRYVIDPSETFVGMIDSDTLTDAIVSFTSYYKNEMGFTEQLIFINSGSKLTLMKSVEDDIKILMLKDRIITAELHTKPRTSPLYNCDHCKEVVDFVFENGELVKLE